MYRELSYFEVLGFIADYHDEPEELQSLFDKMPIDSVEAVIDNTEELIHFLEKVKSRKISNQLH